MAIDNALVGTWKVEGQQGTLFNDISATGIFVRTNTPEPPGTHLNVRFTPKGDEEPLELEGQVIWINAYRPGVANSPAVL